MHLFRPLRSVALTMLLATAMTHGAPAADAPYETKLMRLAEVLGSIHYLRNLCGESGSQWRDQMEALLESENPDTSRRARLVASFNHGYRSFSGVYTGCTSSATAAIDRYMEEGESLSREIVTRYGN